MSTETLTWLNTNVLVGMTKKRGNAWHYRASEQGAEPNHYPQAIPVQDVQRRLFSWKAVQVPVFAQVPASVETATGMTETGEPVRMIEAKNRRAIVRSDSGDVLGVMSGRYTLHQYDEWLVTNVANLLDDDLQIGSAGLLKNGAIAWVSVELADNITTRDGVEFRSHLLATTSFDGSIPTLYKPVDTFVVCDNTRAAALSETSQEIRVRHTAHSVLRLTDAREALGLILGNADATVAEIERLCALPVTARQFDAWLRMFVAPTSPAKAAITRTENTRERMRAMWDSDPRVAPWSGSAFGVLQLANTHRLHERPTKGATIRAERNMVELLNGTSARGDNRAEQILSAVLG